MTPQEWIIFLNKFVKRNPNKKDFLISKLEEAKDGSGQVIIEGNEQGTIKKPLEQS